MHLLSWEAHSNFVLIYDVNSLQNTSFSLYWNAILTFTTTVSFLYSSPKVWWCRQNRCWFSSQVRLPLSLGNIYVKAFFHCVLYFSWISSTILQTNFKVCTGLASWYTYHSLYKGIQTATDHLVPSRLFVNVKESWISQISALKSRNTYISKIKIIINFSCS